MKTDEELRERGLESYTLEHTDRSMIAHMGENCVGTVCALHKRTDHPMREFPQHFRYDRNLMERTCPHGIGHPDPDQIQFWQASGYTPEEVVAEMSHGCDGCCFGAGYKIRRRTS